MINNLVLTASPAVYIYVFTKHKQKYEGHFGQCLFSPLIKKEVGTEYLDWTLTLYNQEV